ncbi:MAG: hypothetical protein EOO73_27950 [Myxococcales bacterium]|nr:MAG: hypothetical protein EOO73_27950 [Myxococcales bacterium]
MAAALAACGARSGLLDPLQSEISGESGSGGSGGSGGAAAGGSAASTGGKVGGGAASASGKVGGGGAGVAGSGQAGACSLPLEDCLAVEQPECPGLRPRCEGRIEFHEVFETNGYSYVNDVATGPSGRAAITGYHFGETFFGSRHFTTDSFPGGRREVAFVVSFDTAHALEWVYQDPEQSHGVALAFAANGDALVHARHLAPSPTGAGIFPVNTLGQQLWRKDWGTSNLVPVGIAVDNDGHVWSTGNVYGRLGYPGSDLDAPTAQQGYLLQTDSAGTLLQELFITPPSYGVSNVLDLQLDAEDAVITIGEGDTTDGRFSSFIRKFSASGAPLLLKELEAPLQLSRVVVDRRRRITLVGSFQGTFEHEGSRFESDVPTLLVAQYSSEGELLWRKTYAGPLEPTAAAVDRFDNLIIAVAGSALALRDRLLVPEHGSSEAAFVLKLRADGSEVWARKLDGAVTLRGAATDASGRIWLGGNFDGEAWLDEDVLSSPNTTGLLVQLSP